MTQGYVIQSINTETVDYRLCARVLAKSIRSVGDNRPICLLTDKIEECDSKLFDQIILIEPSEYGPYSDDWKCYEYSPYDETFKLEADMIVTRSLDSWWNSLKNRDLHIATGCRDYKQQVSQSRFYRQINDDNLLPDLYNGITYFKKSKLAKQFYKIVKQIFKNWHQVNLNLKQSSKLDHGDTDTVYAIAANIIGVENCTIPGSTIQFVHMKQRINNNIIDDWTKELVWELIGSDFRINTISQLYPVHYHVKSLALELDQYYVR
jgi:hypothetical protein